MRKKLKLSEEFKNELIERCKKAEEEYGIIQKALLMDIEKHGAVETAREIIRKRKVSDGYHALASRKALKLSMEALVVESRFGTLFTDEEADYCLSLLCEGGMYEGI